MGYFTKTFKNPDGQWWAEFRNGFTNKITGISFYQSEHSQESSTHIDILNSYGEELRGGAKVPTSALIELCIDFLRANGYEVSHHTEIENEES